MQQSSFQVASRSDQSGFKRLLPIGIFLVFLLALLGIAALGAKTNRVAANEVASPASSRGAALATSYSSEFSNGMPLP